jgi:hypothetical protein
MSTSDERHPRNVAVEVLLGDSIPVSGLVDAFKWLDAEVGRGLAKVSDLCDTMTEYKSKLK